MDTGNLFDTSRHGPASILFVVCLVVLVGVVVIASLAQRDFGRVEVTNMHGQIRGSRRETWLRTFVSWSLSNTIALIAPLMLFMSIQYVPLLTAGVIPFVEPGGMLASFTMNLFHIIGVLIITTPISTWFYQLTGKIYLGALVNAALMTWMFTSSQVIAPIPV